MFIPNEFDELSHEEQLVFLDRYSLDELRTAVDELADLPSSTKPQFVKKQWLAQLYIILRNNE